MPIGGLKLISDTPKMPIRGLKPISDTPKMQIGGLKPISDTPKMPIGGLKPISDTLKNRFRMSMNSLVPRYTPLLLSTDLAADETIRLTIAMFVSRRGIILWLP